MDRFVPRKKMGKKARRQLDRLGRTVWAFSPAVRKVESRKKYNRKRMKHDPCGQDRVFCFPNLPRREKPPIIAGTKTLCRLFSYREEVMDGIQ